MISKQDLRKKLKAARNDMEVSVRTAEDKQIATHLFSLPAFDKARLVLTYLSFGSEVDTWEIVKHAWEDGKTVAVPKCARHRKMDWFVIDGFENLEKSPLGMLEPNPIKCQLLDIAALRDDKDAAIAIVPALAFDCAGYRLGYGGGFYDTFLREFTGVSVGLCRSEFMQDDLRKLGVIEPHDLPVDIVVTP